MNDSTRRAFLGGAAAAIGGVVLAPGIHLIEAAHAASAGADPAVRWGMLIDTTKCASGCDDCVTACQREHAVAAPQRSTDPQWIRKVELKEARTGRTASLPVMCQHCAEPPCVDVCPTGASFKRVDGIVLVDRHRCIGCRYCMLACPYKARSFVHAPLANQRPEVPRGQGCVEGCTLCVHRIDRGQYLSACAEACAQAGHRAIVFGDLNDRSSEIAQRLRELGGSALRADLQLHPAVRYQGL